MLGKMFLHEMRQSWRVPVLMSVIAVVLTVIVKLGIELMAETDFRYEAPSFVLSTMMIFLVAYFIFMIATNFLIFLLIPVRFYRESYSALGYLTHCLPVEKSTILWAHTFCGVIWLLLYMAIDLFALDLLVFRGQSMVIEVMRFVFGPVMREIRNVMQTVGAPAVIAMTLGILYVLLYPFHVILNSFCAVSLGQVFKKHRIAGAVLMYYLLGFAVSIVNSVLMTVILIFSGLIGRELSQTGIAWFVVVVIATALLLLLIQTIVFFVISVYRMNKRLNLE